MPLDTFVPIVVGVGEVKNKSRKPEHLLEPMQLMLQATHLAIQDAALSTKASTQLQSSIDSVNVVHTWTWPYPDLPGLLAEKLDVQPKHKLYSELGGNAPAKLFDEAARRISVGECKVALVTGGEALDSLSVCASAGKLPPPGWTKLDQDVKSVFGPDLSRMPKNLGSTHSVGLPVHVYPFYENAFRAHRGQTVRENSDESAQLYADFAKVAEQNPVAWSHGQAAMTREHIGTLSKKNRMICSPYPLLMNAFNTVNLAGSCILTSTAYAEELGIPQDRWIYPLGGAGTKDSLEFWHRPNFHSSPSISHSLNACLSASALLASDIDLFDFYSCFPIVPKLAAAHLNLPLNGRKPITLLGGLTSFGGAGNNYSMHALIALTRRLRAGDGKHGLVLANGGVLTYQHAVVLSVKPRADRAAYPVRNPLPECASEGQGPFVDENAGGEGTVETYTVEFGRDGRPKMGFVVGRLSNGARFVANHANDGTLVELAKEKEHVGRKGFVSRDGERCLFSFEADARL